MSNVNTRKEKSLDPRIKSWVAVSTGITWESICVQKQNSARIHFHLHIPICQYITRFVQILKLINMVIILYLQSLAGWQLCTSPVWSSLWIWSQSNLNIYFSTDSEKFNIIEESRRIWSVTWQRIYKVERGQKDKTGIASMEEMGTDLALCLHNFWAPPRTLGWAVQLEHHQNQFAKY